MPVFDFNNTPEEKKEPVCTYAIFRSNAPEASADQPILVLDNSARQWKHHSCGVFENPNKRTAFEFKEEGGAVSADILRIDARFVSLVRWLGEHRINVRLSGENRPEGYAVYRIRETAFGGGTKLSAEDGFLQFMIERLLASSAPSEELEDEDQVENGDEMKLTSLQSITDFLTCAGRTLPDNIQRAVESTGTDHHDNPQCQQMCKKKADYRIFPQCMAQPSWNESPGGNRCFCLPECQHDPLLFRLLPKTADSSIA